MTESDFFFIFSIYAKVHLDKLHKIFFDIICTLKYMLLFLVVKPLYSVLRQFFTHIYLYLANNHTLLLQSKYSIPNLPPGMNTDLKSKNSLDNTEYTTSIYSPEQIGNI